MPLLGSKRLFRLEANRIIVPITGDVDIHFTLIEMDSKAFSFGIVDHARHHAAIRNGIRKDPDRERELVSHIEVPYRPATDEVSHLERTRPPHPPHSDR